MRSFQISQRITYRGLKSTQLFFEEIDKIPVLTADEEFCLALKAKEGDQKSIDKLISHNLRFVVSVSKMYASDSESQQDLISAGCLGIIQAAKKFDPHKGFKFISFAVWYIRMEMTKHLSHNKKTIRVPESHSEIHRRLDEVENKLYSKNLIPPTKEEMVDYIRENFKTFENLSMVNFEEILDSRYSYNSVDSPLNTDSESTLLDVIQNDEKTPSEILEDTQKNQLLNNIFCLLNERQSYVVKRFFGIGYEYPIPLNMISDELDISKATVETTYKKAMERLKRHSKSLKNLSLQF
jgi:RNA polymerase primary sigma factor